MKLKNVNLCFMDEAKELPVERECMRLIDFHLCSISTRLPHKLSSSLLGRRHFRFGIDKSCWVLFWAVECPPCGGAISLRRCESGSSLYPTIIAYSRLLTRQDCVKSGRNLKPSWLNTNSNSNISIFSKIDLIPPWDISSFLNYIACEFGIFARALNQS